MTDKIEKVIQYRIGYHYFETIEEAEQWSIEQQIVELALLDTGTYEKLPKKRFFETMNDYFRNNSQELGKIIHSRIEFNKSETGS